MFRSDLCLVNQIDKADSAAHSGIYILDGRATIQP